MYVSVLLLLIWNDRFEKEGRRWGFGFCAFSCLPPGGRLHATPRHPLAFGEVKAAENGTAGFCSKMAKSTMLETVIGQPGNGEG